MDPSLKILIPHEENLFPAKETLKVWGKGAFVGLFPGVGIFVVGLVFFFSLFFFVCLFCFC